MAIEVLSVPPVEAVGHFRRKDWVVGFDWRDVDAAQHAHAFTVAKVMRKDLLATIRTSVDKALAEGMTFEQFERELTPLLQKEGWWGRREMVDPKTGEKRLVQLGSPRRLRTIYDTNIRMASAHGRWERVQRMKEAMPYLRYVAVGDARTRPEHMAWHGIVLPVDDPFWDTHAPPNGWHCRCTIVQLGEGDLKRYGYGVSKSPPIQTRSWHNARTGKTVQVPRGIDPGFQHNAGTVGQGYSVRDPNAIPELDDAVAMHERLAAATGSNPGGMFRGSDGVRRYVKLYEDPAQAYTEAVANRAYRELGLNAPESSIVRGADGSIRGIASDVMDHQFTLGARPLRKDRASRVLNGFSADVWLANWDAVGLDLDNIVVIDSRHHRFARIDQGGSLLFRARAGRKPLERLATLSEWDGFASPGRNPAYARVFEAAGLGGADELGSKALRQIAAIRRLRARTNDFEDLVPAVDGVADADRDAILKLLRDRATKLDAEIVPRVKAAMRATADMPAHEIAFVRKMGGAYAGMRSRAIGKVSDSAPRLGLSDAEITARYAYTTSDSTWGYGPINRALRSDDETKRAGYLDYRDTLNAGLAKLPDHVGTVKRRTRLTTEELARYRNSKGEVIVEQAFTSTSHGGRAAFSGPHEFVIESAHGKLVQPWSAYPGEREVLFAAGSRFKVLEVESLGGGRYKIRLREVQ